MPTCIIYLRKSTDREDKQKLSIEGQLQACREIAERAGYDVAEVIEDRKTAKQPGREGFARLMVLANTGKAPVVICWKMDRLSRNPVDGGAISWALQNGTIQEIHSIDGVFRTGDNVVMLGIHFGMATQYIIDLRKNVMRGMRQKLAMGGVVQKAPFGYRLVNKELVVHDEESNIVKKAFEMRRNKATYEEISEMFKFYGYKKSSASVEKILSNAFYYGMMKFAGEYFSGNYPQIVSQKQFLEADRVGKGVYSSIDHTKVFFSSLVTRFEDKKPLCVSIKKGKYVYYHEHSRDVKLTGIRRSISQHHIMKSFEEIIEGYSALSPEECSQFRARFYEFSKGSIEIVQKERSILLKKMSGLQADNEGLTKMRSREEISSSEYLAAKNKNIEDIREIEEKLAGMTCIDDEIMTKFDTLVELTAVLSGTYKLKTDEEKVFFIKMLLVELSVDSDNTLRIKQKEPFQTLFSRNISFGDPSEIQVELFISLVEFLTNDLEVFRRAVLDPRNSLTKR